MSCTPGELLGYKINYHSDAFGWTLAPEHATLFRDAYVATLHGGGTSAYADTQARQAVEHYKRWVAQQQAEGATAE